MAKKESQEQLKKMYAALDKLSRDMSTIDLSGTYQAKTKGIYSGRKKKVVTKAKGE